MIEVTRRWKRCTLAAALAVALALPAGAWAQGTRGTSPPGSTTAVDYVIGPEDVLQISVWLHPELERTVTVTSQGNIVFPPIGEVKATELNTRQLGDRIADRLSTYLRQTTTVTVNVTQYMSQSVYVTGAVNRPGRYGFEHIPGLLDVLNSAGGPAANAELGRIQILRREGAGRRVLIADLNSSLRDGSEANLPDLRAGDVIVVSASLTAAGGVSPDAVGVLGEVNRPGVYPVAPGQDLWMILALAGGPTGRSDLSRIKVLTKDEDAKAAVTVNLQETLNRGNRTPYLIKPGDIVWVDPKGVSLWQGFGQFLGVSRDVASLVALVKVLQNE